MSAPSGFRPLQLRLAPEYRRCAVYVVIGCLLVAGVVVGLGRADGVDVASTKMITCFGAWLACAVALLFLTIGFRLRIDEHGIWRRRFVRWDLWPWEAFEQGRVRLGKFGDQLTYPDKPWYWRTMSASFLGESDRAAFEAVVHKYRVLPPPPELPEVLTLRCGLLRRVELSAEGVRAGLADHEGELIAWSDVDRAEVMRANHDRPDFVTLTLHPPAPAKPVRLSRREGQNWQGPDAEMIALYLQRHLGDGRFEVTALRGPPADAAEADRRLARLDRDERQYRMIGRFAGWSLAVLAAVMLRPWEWPNPLNWGPADWVDVAINVGAAAVVIGLQGSMVLGVVYFHNRDIRRRREEVGSWKVAHVLPVPESTN